MSNRSRVRSGVPAGGQFTAEARAEVAVSLGEAPLSAAEFGTAADKSHEMRRMGTGDVVTLPDGSQVTISGDGVVGDIVESGIYVRTHPGGYKTGVEFADLSERSGVADDVAFASVRDARSVVTEATEVIHAYTRSQALSDGTLRDRLDDGTDLNKLAKEAGIPVPVAFTQEAFADSVAWSASNARLQDESGRAWDVLYMSSRPIRAHAMRNGGKIAVGDRIPFTFVRVPNTTRATQSRSVEMHAVFGTDDEGKPCFTYELVPESSAPQVNPGLRGGTR